MSRPSPDTGAWRQDPEGVVPVVLVLGGFLTSPPLYWHMRGRLLRRGVAGVHIAPIWTPDWLLVVARGHGSTATRAGGRPIADRWNKRAPTDVCQRVPARFKIHSRETAKTAGKNQAEELKVTELNLELKARWWEEGKIPTPLSWTRDREKRKSTTPMIM